MSDTPDNEVTPFGNGRQSNGRFGKGNPGGPGNPYSKRVAAIRQALMEAADPEKIKAAVVALLDQAVAGDRAALAEILDRTIGKPTSADLLERIEAIEAILEKRDERHTDPISGN